MNETQSKNPNRLRTYYQRLVAVSAMVGSLTCAALSVKTEKAPRPQTNKAVLKQLPASDTSTGKIEYRADVTVPASVQQLWWRNILPVTTVWFRTPHVPQPISERAIEPPPLPVPEEPDTPETYHPVPHTQEETAARADVPRSQYWHGNTSSTARIEAADEFANAKLAYQLAKERSWFSVGQVACLDNLWAHESNFNEQSTNPSSGAYGIPQALPGNKMHTAGDDWRTNPATQIEWGLDYIEDRYGTPCGAEEHEQTHNWY